MLLENYLFLYAVWNRPQTHIRITPWIGKNNGVVISKGLQVGEMIIVEGYQRLSENSPIEIVK